MSENHPNTDKFDKDVVIEYANTVLAHDGLGVIYICDILNIAYPDGLASVSEPDALDFYITHILSDPKKHQQYEQMLVQMKSNVLQIIRSDNPYQDVKAAESDNENEEQQLSSVYVAAAPLTAPENDQSTISGKLTSSTTRKPIRQQFEELKLRLANEHQARMEASVNPVLEILRKQMLKKEALNKRVEDIQFASGTNVDVQELGKDLGL